MSATMKETFAATNAVGAKGEAFVASTLEAQGDTIYGPDTYDFDMWSKRWGRLDVKCDMRSPETGNFFVETGIITVETGEIKPTDRSQVDHYAYTDLSNVWLLSRHNVRVLSALAKTVFRVAHGPLEPNGKRAIGVLVPRVKLTEMAAWCTLQEDAA